MYLPVSMHGQSNCRDALLLTESTIWEIAVFVFVFVILNQYDPLTISSLLFFK